MKTSETISKIAPAIIKFQSEIGKIHKGSENPFFKNKYAALPDILSAIAEPLKNAELAVMQFPTGVNQLETVLLHISGEWISETYEMKPVKQDPQSLGSSITYARRYAIGAILNLNIDEDDDGNEASAPPKGAKNKPTITTTQFDDLLKSMIGNFPVLIGKKIFDNYTDLYNTIVANYYLTQKQSTELLSIFNNLKTNK
jgi:hypothetical protein